MILTSVIPFSRVRWFRSLQIGDKVLLKIRPDHKMREERGLSSQEDRNVIVTITDIEEIEVRVDHILEGYRFGIVENFYGRYELCPLEAKCQQ